MYTYIYIYSRHVFVFMQNRLGCDQQTCGYNHHTWWYLPHFVTNNRVSPTIWADLRPQWFSPQMKVGNGQPAKMYQHVSWDQFLLEQTCWPRLMATGDVRKNAINYWHLGLGHPEPPRMQSTYCAPIIAWGSKHSYSGKVVLLLLGMGHNWGAEGINKIGKWLYFKLGNFL